MAESWRDIVARNSQFRVAAAQANPGIAGLGQVLQMAMAQANGRKVAAQEEARDTRKMATTAVFNKYPQVAAQQLGMNIPGTKPGEVPQGPAGMVLDKVQYDENGNPTTVYTNPLTDKTGGPTWGQEQRVEALKTGLRMGKVVIGKEFGEPSVYEAKNMEDALKAIQDAGLSPELFSEELRLYDVVEQKRDKKTKRVMQKLRDGRVIWQDTKEPIS